MQVQSLGWDDPLEDGMATHSSILAWGIPQTKQSGRLQSMVLQRVRNDTTEAIEHANTYTVFLPSESPQGAQFEPAVADGLRVSHPLFTDMARNIFPPQDQTLQTTALG